MSKTLEAEEEEEEQKSSAVQGVFLSGGNRIRHRNCRPPQSVPWRSGWKYCFRRVPPPLLCSVSAPPQSWFSLVDRAGINYCPGRQNGGQSSFCSHQCTKFVVHFHATSISQLPFLV